MPRLKGPSAKAVKPRTTQAALKAQESVSSVKLKLEKTIKPVENQHFDPDFSEGKVFKYSVFVPQFFICCNDLLLALQGLHLAVMRI